MKRTHWLATWRGTVWEVRSNERWLPLPRHRRGTWLVLTACNPRGRLLSRTANRHRDEALRRALPHSCPLRARGRSPDGSWAEPGWMIPLRQHADAGRWLCRFQQIAALVVDERGWSLRWCDGVSGRWLG